MPGSIARPILPAEAPPEVARLSPFEVSQRYLDHLRAAWDDAHPTRPSSAGNRGDDSASFDPAARGSPPGRTGRRLRAADPPPRSRRRRSTAGSSKAPAAGASRCDRRHHPGGRCRRRHHRLLADRGARSATATSSCTAWRGRAHPARRRQHGPGAGLCGGRKLAARAPGSTPGRCGR